MRMETVSTEHVTIRQDDERWVLTRATESNRGAVINLFIDHHFGKPDDLTGQVVNYKFLPEPVRFMVISEQESEALYEEAEEHGDEESSFFTPRQAAMITGIPVEAIVEDMIRRWDALKLIMQPGIATSS
jgi:hypothetical protein